MNETHKKMILEAFHVQDESELDERQRRIIYLVDAMEKQQERLEDELHQFQKAAAHAWLAERS